MIGGFIMREFWNTIQLIFTAVGGWLGWFLGGSDGLLFALIAFVVIDYITGVMCAISDKKLSSAVGFKGICRKVLIFALVGGGHILDTRVIGAGSVLRTAVIFFYLSNEGISLLENAAHLGLPVPKKLKDVLEQLHKRSERRTMMKIKGVDLSYCQEGISFPVLKQAGVRFAIIRAGFSTKKDVTMDKFVADCKKYGVDYGFYWYSYAMNVGQAQTEAEKCIEVIKNLSPTYPVFFDMEEKKQISGLNTDTRTKMAIAFCEKIRQAGFKPGIYANPSFMENYYDKSRIVGKYDIWLAHWTKSPDCPSKYNYGQTMWQWGLDRIGGYDVDGDICFCEYVNPTPVKKTVEQLAKEVIRGDWGNGAERKQKLTAAGYDYSAVQKRVNKLLR